MVKKWIKQLKSINLNSNINFDQIIIDILSGNFKKYDIKPLSGYENLYRLRVSGYRVIFKDIDNDIRILFIGKRGDIYKWLKNN